VYICLTDCGHLDSITEVNTVLSAYASNAETLFHFALLMIYELLNTGIL